VLQNSVLKNFTNILLNNLCVFGNALHQSHCLFRVLFEMTLASEKVRVHLARQKLVEKLLCFLYYFVLGCNHSANRKNYLPLRSEVAQKTRFLLEPIRLAGVSSEDAQGSARKRLKKPDRGRSPGEGFNPAYFYLLLSQFPETFNHAMLPLREPSWLSRGAARAWSEHGNSLVPLLDRDCKKVFRHLMRKKLDHQYVLCLDGGAGCMGLKKQKSFFGFAKWVALVAAQDLET
jgi:hypothetical protein